MNQGLKTFVNSYDFVKVKIEKKSKDVCKING